MLSQFLGKNGKDGIVRTCLVSGLYKKLAQLGSVCMYPRMKSSLSRSSRNMWVISSLVSWSNCSAHWSMVRPSISSLVNARSGQQLNYILLAFLPSRISVKNVLFTCTQSSLAPEVLDSVVRDLCAVGWNTWKYHCVSKVPETTHEAWSRVWDQDGEVAGRKERG